MPASVLPFGAYPLSVTGPIIPGAVLRVVNARGVVRCDADTPKTTFRHDQPAPSATWVINHAMGRTPNVRTYSVGGREMLGEVVHTTLTQAVVYFDGPTAGYAVCV